MHIIIPECYTKIYRFDGMTVAFCCCAKLFVLLLCSFLYFYFANYIYILESTCAVVNITIQRRCSDCNGRQKLCWDMQVCFVFDGICFKIFIISHVYFSFASLIMLSIKCSDMRLGVQAQTVAMNFEKVK